VKKIIIWSCVLAGIALAGFGVYFYAWTKYWQERRVEEFSRSYWQNVARGCAWDNPERWKWASSHGCAEWEKRNPQP
jgi:hypothetical protein